MSSIFLANLPNLLGYSCQFSGQVSFSPSLKNFLVFSFVAGNLDNLRKTQQDSGATRATFAPVWDPAYMIGVQARGFYDESYDPAVSVIAEIGRAHV